MSEDSHPSDADAPDPAAALLGTPVEVSRRHQGKSQAEYLRNGPGRVTADALDTSGIKRYRRGRQLAAAGLILLAAAGIVALLLQIL